MLTELDFYVDFAAHGDLLGLGFGSKPEAWAEKLGTGYWEGLHPGGQLGWQFGALDVSFDDGPAGWSTQFIYLQVHKLAWGKDFDLPRSVRDKYGDFTVAVEFDQLADRLAQQGVPVYRITHPLNEGVTNYWVEDTLTTITVTSTADYARESGIAIGHIRGISRALGDSTPADRRVPHRP